MASSSLQNKAFQKSFAYISLVFKNCTFSNKMANQRSRNRDKLNIENNQTMDHRLGRRHLSHMMTEPKSLSLYIFAFRPICCLLFLAETTHFAFFGGKRRRIKDNKNAFLARFGVHFSCAIFDYKTGEILKF